MLDDRYSSVAGHTTYMMVVLENVPSITATVIYYLYVEIKDTWWAGARSIGPYSAYLQPISVVSTI
jgi:hypothetical protein